MLGSDPFRDKSGNRIKGWVTLVNPAPLVILSLAESVQRHISPISAGAVRTASVIANSGIWRPAVDSPPLPVESGQSTCYINPLTFSPPSDSSFQDICSSLYSILPCYPEQRFSGPRSEQQTKKNPKANLLRPGTRIIPRENQADKPSTTRPTQWLRCHGSDCEPASLRLIK